jgi:hypothetical protein
VIPDLSTILPYVIGALVMLLLPRLGVKLPGALAPGPTPAPGMPPALAALASSPLLPILLDLLRQRIGEQAPPDPHTTQVLDLIRELLPKGKQPDAKT